MLTQTRSSSYHAIGNLTLKACNNREQDGGVYTRYISVLRSQRNIAAPALPHPYTELRDPNPSVAPNVMASYDNDLPAYNRYDMDVEQ